MTEKQWFKMLRSLCRKSYLTWDKFNKLKELSPITATKTETLIIPNEGDCCAVKQRPNSVVRESTRYVVWRLGPSCDGPFLAGVGKQLCFPTTRHYSGFGDINIGEYENLETVVEYADNISEQDDLSIALVAAYDFDEAKKMIEDDYHGAYDSEVEFAEQIVDEGYGQLLPDNLAGYFDYQAFARDFFSCEYCSVRLDGNVHVFACY